MVVSCSSTRWKTGIHHSVQPKFWKMVLQTAQRNNVQVLATTHSWDCVKGFAEAAAELEEVEGVPRPPGKARRQTARGRVFGA